MVNSISGGHRELFELLFRVLRKRGRFLQLAFAVDCQLTTVNCELFARVINRPFVLVAVEEVAGKSQGFGGAND